MGRYRGSAHAFIPKRRRFASVWRRREHAFRRSAHPPASSRDRRPLGSTQSCLCAVRHESPTEMIQKETEALGPCSTSDGIRNSRRPDAAHHTPDRPRRRHHQGRPDYTVVLRRMSGWPHLRDPWWSRQSAVVLVAYRERSDDAIDRVATLEDAKAQFQKSWDAGRSR